MFVLVLIAGIVDKFWKQGIENKENAMGYYGAQFIAGQIAYTSTEMDGASKIMLTGLVVICWLYTILWYFATVRPVSQLEETARGRQ